MRSVYKLVVVLVFSAVYFTSCQPEVGFDDPAGGGNGGGGNGGGNNNGACNNTVMNLKSIQSTFDRQVIEATWNADGTISSIKMSVQLSGDYTAKYIYESGRIKEAVLYNNSDNSIVDTAVFRYNTEGKVDSMYRKHYNQTISLGYTNGKLSRYTGYSFGFLDFYWTITTDANDNIVKAENYWKNGATYDNESTYTYTRDARKNPFAGLAPYMMFLDDDYVIFRYWGANNYIDQRYQDRTGSGIDMTTGNKYIYNSNCYPLSSQTTIYGQVVFTDPDFVYTYY
ncbi:MAG: hypothetical protein ABW019_03650 [Chitinophagaceae bacterium]